MTETKPASKAAAPAEKKAEPKKEGGSPAKAAGAPKPAAGAPGAMGAGGMPAMPDPMADLKAMMSKAVGGIQRELDMVQQKLGGGKVTAELDSGDIVIPAAMVGKIPAALRQQFETCVGCSANDLTASKRGQQMQGQQKVSKGPSGGAQKSASGAPGSDKPKESKPSTTKSASTSSASRA